MTDAKRGLFIVFEGLDGSGKTTQAKMLHDALFKVEPLPILTAEPDGPLPWTLNSDAPAAEWALWFAYNRASHVRRLITPSLERWGNTVICDRYVLSSLAYQVADGAPLEWVREINKYAPEPDLTVFIGVPVYEAMQRVDARDGKPITGDELARLFRVQVQYEQRLGETPSSKKLIVDGTQDKDAIHAQILARVKEMIG